jgi:hypothetical protein
MLAVLLLLGGISWGVYTLTPPNGINLTGHWETEPNFGGTVLDLKHSRFRLAGTGHWYTDCGEDSPLVASGSVEGRKVTLAFLPAGKEDWEWGIPETNTFYIYETVNGTVLAGHDSIDVIIPTTNGWKNVDMMRLYRK